MEKQERMLCVMLDVSRDAVKTVKSIKKFIDYIQPMGYTMLQLYTEDIIKIEGEEYIGYMRGAYSVEEIQEVDCYAKEKGIELVPCIQTLGHLAKIFRFYQHGEIMDTPGVLLIDEEKTYEYIERVFKTVAKCFTSRRINIGMDEAGDIGKGQYLDKFGYKNKTELMLRHLKRVVAIAEKYGFEPMMWSDMFYRLESTEGYETSTQNSFSQEIINGIPENIRLIYWDYFTKDEAKHQNKLNGHLKLRPAEKIIYAGGAITFGGLTPLNALSIESTKAAFAACAKSGVTNVMVTVWEDDGAECSCFSVLPSLLCFAQFAQGNFDIEDIKAKFLQLVGVPFDDFMKLDLPNSLYENEPIPVSPSKYMLFSDYFLGYFDYLVSEGVEELYKRMSAELAPLAQGEWGYLFDIQKKLADVLALKYELGVKTRAAYKAGDKKELKRLVEENYKPLVGLIESLYEAMRKQWFLENKGYGSQVHDLRGGALAQRTKSCAERLLAYVNGDIFQIEELEEEILPVGWNGKGRPDWFPYWKQTNW